MLFPFSKIVAEEIVNWKTIPEREKKEELIDIA